VAIAEVVPLESESHFTTSQLEAIRTIDQNLQIVACAGAGKTEVVAERVAEILRVKQVEGIAPRNIVAFTFTDRAGAELKDRIVEKIHLRLGELNGLAEMYVGTIHGYCLDLLQTHLPELLPHGGLRDPKTGATGLEPATSGVTGRASPHHASRRQTRKHASDQGSSGRCALGASPQPERSRTRLGHYWGTKGRAKPVPSAGWLRNGNRGARSTMYVVHT